MKKRAILWFTKNLRTQDNAIINWAAENGYDVIALGFEPRQKSFRQKQCYLNAALEIQQIFRSRGLGFYILDGAPEVDIPKWCQLNSVDVVLALEPYNSRDKKVINQLVVSLGSCQVRTFSDQTLLDRDQLPFRIADMPLVFSEFRRAVEVNPVLPEPQNSLLEKLSGFAALVPSETVFSDVVFSDSVAQHTGGLLPFDIQPTESASWDRVTEYFFKTQSLSHYKDTRNGMLEKNESSKLSVGLAHGSISARSIYSEVLKYQEHFGSNESTKWFRFELLWRDYFKFLSLKIGDRLFSANGLLKNPKSWPTHQRTFETWCQGQTGVDFVDANMIELNSTGWMSNRGRQNVASYLAKQLGLDWTLGAQYFSSQLIDDDLESNWGNWLYISGAGTDPRDRAFNMQRQADVYDPQGTYRKRWLSIKGQSTT